LLTPLTAARRSPSREKAIEETFRPRLSEDGAGWPSSDVGETPGLRRSHTRRVFPLALTKCDRSLEYAESFGSTLKRSSSESFGGSDSNDDWLGFSISKIRKPVCEAAAKRRPSLE